MSATPTDPHCPTKAADLEITEAADGYVVYQPDRDRVHYLNRTALLVLELCDGENDIGAITAFLQQAWEMAAPPVAEVQACLAQLQSESLVV